MSNKYDDDEMIGFKDFMEGEDKSFLENLSQKKRKDADFELITFLEQESTRISKHIETFEEKVYVIKNYSQNPNLNIEAEAENIQARIETVELCKKENSPLFKNLTEVFRQFF
jgi:hypothetical protein